MDTANEILDAIEILSDKKISENITKVLTGICTSVNINKNTCVMDSNGVRGTVYFYGSPPEVNGLYRIFVPSNDMSRAFVIVPPEFTVNPNLFDNWDYSINQRNTTTITTATAYYADRWRKYGTGTTGTVQKGLIHLINNGSATCGWQQRFEASRLLGGLTYTFSALVKCQTTAAVRVSYGTALDNITATKSYSPPLNTWVLLTWTFVLPTSTTYYNFRIRGIAAQTDLYIGPVKLELGSHQTLVHKESGAWVLNEVPEEGEQLRRSQRYFWRFSPPQYVAMAIAFGIDANTARAIIYLPEQMRTSPTLNLNASSGFFLTGASGDIFSVTCSGVWSSPNAVCVDFKKDGAFEVNAPYFIRGDANAYIDISAEL